MNATADFSFSTVPHLICESGSASRLGEHIANHYPEARHILLVTDAGFMRTGLVAPSAASMALHGLQVHVYADVIADPPEHMVLASVDFARARSIDLVVGLGGGSSMDVAKLIAVLVPSSQPIQDMYGIGNVKGKRLPLIQIPTTAGTGSEVTNIAIVTTGETTKSGVVAPQLYGDLVILDALLTVGLPRAVTAATGIDAMVHAIEAFTSRHKKNILSDMLARQALQLLSGNLRQVCDDGNNLPARQAMLLGAYLAGQSFSNAPVAAVHALAYPIGGIFHVPHGLSNALVLPHVLEFNLPEAMSHYAELASIINPQAAGTEEARAQSLIAEMQQIAEFTGIETTLRQVGVEEADLDQLAEAAMQQTRLLGNNPRELTLPDARAIYAAAF